MKESSLPAEYHGDMEPEFSLSFLNQIVAGPNDSRADKQILPANENLAIREGLLERRESGNEYCSNATGGAQDVFLISRTNTPGLDHLYSSSNGNLAHPNSLSNNIITATSSPYIKTPMVNKSSEPLFDTPYLNQLYADYVPTSNPNFVNDELPSLSDISLSNMHGFRLDTPLNDRRYFKTPSKNSLSKTIISHSTLKKISGLISTPLKEVLEDCDNNGNINNNYNTSISNTNNSKNAKTVAEEEADDDNASQVDERASPCVKHQIHLNTTSISNSTTSQIFSQHSVKGDITHDTTKLSTRSGGNGFSITNTPGKEFQLFSDFSSPTRKLKPLSRSTTILSNMAVTPAKIPNIKIKTPDSVNSTSSTIIIESTTKANKGIRITESIDASPTPMTKSPRFLISKSELKENNTNNSGKELQLPSTLNTSTPDSKQVFSKFNLPPIMGSFTQGPAIGTFRNKKIKRMIKPIPPQQPRKEFNIHMMNASGKRKNKSNVNGQQFQFVMTDMRKFTEPRAKKHNVLKESTNIISNSPKKKRRVN